VSVSVCMRVCCLSMGNVWC